MFEMTPDGRNRVDSNDAVRQTVPEFGSSNRKSPATDSRQLDCSGEVCPLHTVTAAVSVKSQSGVSTTHSDSSR